MPLSLLGDTGGGAMLITRAAADRIGLNPEKRVSEDGEFEVIDTPRLTGGTAIPSSAVAFDGILVRDPEGTRGDGLLRDGLLGQSWFAGRSWRFDYPRKELWLLRRRAANRGRSRHLSHFPADTRRAQSQRLPARLSPD